MAPSHLRKLFPDIHKFTTETAHQKAKSKPKIGIYGSPSHSQGENILLRFLGEIGYDISNQNIIYIDNQGAIALAHNPEHHARTKHVDIQYHFIRNGVEDGTTRLEYCPTEDMVADGLTKALGPERHRKLARMMGMWVWQKSEDYAITKV